MWTRFAPRLRKIFFGAMEEARQHGSAQVTAEHLLLSILRDPQCAGFYILTYGGAQPDVLRRLIQERIAAPATRNSHDISLAPSARRAIELAEDESQKLQHSHVGTEHVLLGLIRGTSGPAGEALDRLGITYEKARQGLLAWRSAGMPRQAPQPLVRRRLPRFLLDWSERFIEPAARKLAMGYKVYVRKSIGHPGFAKNPYPLYRSLRRDGPVRRDPLVPVWIVSGYEQVQTVLRDPRFRRDPFSSDSLPDAVRHDLGIESARIDSASAAELFGMQLLFLDPPRHTRLRSLFAKAFTPRVVQELRPRILQITNSLLDRVMTKGTMDLISDLAYPLPTMVIAELLGFPPEDYEKLKRWSDDFAGLLGLDPSEKQRNDAAASLAEMHEYFRHVVARLRFAPQQNLLSDLLSLEDQGDHLGDDELFANCVLLLAAGHETTTNLIGNGTLALLQNRSQWAALRNDPSLIGSAIEELLRYDSPVQWTSRIASEELELGGKQIAAGDFVLASLGAANRDPSQFDGPESLDITRKENKHIAFGSGIHFCLGAALARLEGQIAIATLVTRFPKLRLASRKLRWHGGVIFRGLQALPVVW